MYLGFNYGYNLNGLKIAYIYILLQLYALKIPYISTAFSFESWRPNNMTFLLTAGALYNCIYIYMHTSTNVHMSIKFPRSIVWFILLCQVYKSNYMLPHPLKCKLRPYIDLSTIKNLCV